MPYENRNCVCCGILFEPYQYNQTRCGDCVKKVGSKYKGTPPAKECPVCGKSFVRKTPRQTYCSKECGGTQRSGYVKQTYGITQQDYLRMFKEQDGCCAICKRRETATDKNGKILSLAIDHCHAGGHIRGLLCRQCNVGLGNFQDNITFLKAAIKYLESSETIPSGSTVQAALEAPNTLSE